MVSHRSFSMANPFKGAADNVVPMALLLSPRAFCSIYLLPSEKSSTRAIIQANWTISSQVWNWTFSCTRWLPLSPQDSSLSSYPLLQPCTENWGKSHLPPLPCRGKHQTKTSRPSEWSFTITLPSYTVMHDITLIWHVLSKSQTYVYASPVIF